MFRRKTSMIDAADALPGRANPMPVTGRHTVLGSSTTPPWTTGSGRPAEVLSVAFGCFWGAERIIWKLPGVLSTAVGYQGGYTPNPTYEEVCSGQTGHAETVLVAYDPDVTGPEQLLKAFWENHDPTQGNRQGNDVGTQYRSAIYWTTPEQRAAALATRDAFAEVLRANGFREPTTEIAPAGTFYYAEDYHQQYLDKNPGGYCMHGPNGMTCPVGIVRQDQLPSQESVLRKG
jgi:peptide-methionine (S)-S-oxide reductase